MTRGRGAVMQGRAGTPPEESISLVTERAPGTPNGLWRAANIGAFPLMSPDVDALLVRAVNPALMAHDERSRHRLYAVNLTQTN